MDALHPLFIPCQPCLRCCFGALSNMHCLKEDDMIVLGGTLLLEVLALPPGIKKIKVRILALGFIR